MNEVEFKELWEAEKAIYKAWGNFVSNKIILELEEKEINVNEFLKVPARVRLKDNESLIDKAFYRPGKDYLNPYNDIEDKVGVRFVVLFLNDIDKICDIVTKTDEWDFDECKHFDADKAKDPLLFTYQSVHYILKPKNELSYNNVKIPSSVSCELQIRTLLQHAHAELTHDSIYKSKRTVRPEVHRTVAKSMALIETTDNFFIEAVKQLNYGPLQEFSIINRLDNIYFNITDLKPFNKQSSLVIWDEFEEFISEELVGEIESLVNSNQNISRIIKERYSENHLYQQSIILFVFWLIKKRKSRLLLNWPLPRNHLETFAMELGISIESF